MRLLLLGLLAACEAEALDLPTGAVCDSAQAETDSVDADCDGYPAGPDCDDHDWYVNPGVPEQNNGYDDNCDGDAGAWYGCGQTSYAAAALPLLLVRRRRGAS